MQLSQCFGLFQFYFAISSIFQCSAGRPTYSNGLIFTDINAVGFHNDNITIQGCSTCHHHHGQYWPAIRPWPQLRLIVIWLMAVVRLCGTSTSRNPRAFSSTAWIRFKFPLPWFHSIRWHWQDLLIKSIFRESEWVSRKYKGKFVIS